MNMQYKFVITLVMSVLITTGIEAGEGGEQGLRLQIERLFQENDQLALMCCQACKGSADISFLFGQQEQQGDEFSRCTSCRGIFHNRCFQGVNCPNLNCDGTREVGVDPRHIDQVWQERRRLYARYAELDSQFPDGFRDHEHWVQSYVDQDDAAQSIFSALMEHSVQQRDNLDVPEPSAEEIINDIQNLSGDSCGICLQNMTAQTMIGDNVSIVRNNNCSHEMCGPCRVELEHHNRVSPPCPYCRNDRGRWEVSDSHRTQAGLLRPELRPGYHDNDEVLRCSARAEIYRHAGLFLFNRHTQLTQNPRQSTQNQQRIRHLLENKLSYLYRRRNIGLAITVLSGAALAFSPPGTIACGIATTSFITGSASTIAYQYLCTKIAKEKGDLERYVAGHHHSAALA